MTGPAPAGREGIRDRERCDTLVLAALSTAARDGYGVLQRLQDGAGRTISELFDTNDRMGRELGALLQRVESANTALGELVAGADANLGAVEQGLAGRIEQVQRALERIATETGRASAGVSAQVESLRGAADGALQEASRLAETLDGRGRSLGEQTAALLLVEKQECVGWKSFPLRRGKGLGRILFAQCGRRRPAFLSFQDLCVKASIGQHQEAPALRPQQSAFPGPGICVLAWRVRHPEPGEGEGLTQCRHRGIAGVLITIEPKPFAVPQPSGLPRRGLYLALSYPLRQGRQQR